MINWTNNSPNNSAIWSLTRLAQWTASGEELPEWVKAGDVDDRPWLVYRDDITRKVGRLDQVTQQPDGSITIHMYMNVPINDWTVEIRQQSGPGRLRWPGWGAIDALWADPGAQAYDAEEGDLTHMITRIIRYREDAFNDWKLVDHVAATGEYDIEYAVEDSHGATTTLPPRSSIVTKKIDRKPLLGRVTLGGEGGYPWNSFNFLDNGKMYVPYTDMFRDMFGDISSTPNYQMEVVAGTTWHSVDNLLRFAYGNYNKLAIFRDGTCHTMNTAATSQGVPDGVRQSFTNSWIRDNVQDIKDVFTPSSYDYSKNIFILMNNMQLNIMSVKDKYKNVPPVQIAGDATEILAINQSHNRDCLVAHADDTVWHYATTDQELGWDRRPIMMQDNVTRLKASDILFITIGDPGDSSVVVFKNDPTKLYKMETVTDRNLSSFKWFTRVLSDAPATAIKDVVSQSTSTLDLLQQPGEHFVDAVANEFHLAIMTSKRVHAFKCAYGDYTDASTPGNYHKQFEFDYCVQPISMLPATAYAMVLRASDGYYMLGNGDTGWNGYANHFKVYTHMARLDNVNSLAQVKATLGNRENPFQVNQCLTAEPKFIGYTNLGFQFTRADVDVGETQYIYELSTAHDEQDLGVFNDALIVDQTQSRDEFQQDIIFNNLSRCSTYYARVRAVGEHEDISPVATSKTDPCEMFTLSGTGSSLNDTQYSATAIMKSSEPQITELNLTDAFNGRHPNQVTINHMDLKGDFDSSAEHASFDLLHPDGSVAHHYSKVRRYQSNSFFQPVNGPSDVDISDIIYNRDGKRMLKVSSTCTEAVGDLWGRGDLYQWRLNLTATYYTEFNITTGTPNTSVSLLEDTTAEQTMCGVIRPIVDDQFDNLFIASGDGVPSSCAGLGSGRVVFDGGFPKFFNKHWSDSYATSNDTMYDPSTPGQLPYLVNSIKYTSANRGLNRTGKLLYINDGSASYDVGENATRPEVSFNRSVFGCAAFAGLTGEYFMNLTGSLSHHTWLKNNTMTQDQWFNYFMEYDCVFWVGVNIAADDGPTRITSSMKDALREYYIRGGGLIFTTDHDVFQTGVNQIVPMWGVSFTGNINRTPGHSDYLLSNILSNTNYIPTGQHPLFADMSPDSRILAGGSEGRIVYTQGRNSTYTSDANGQLFVSSHNDGSSINSTNRLWWRTSNDCGAVIG